MCGKITHNNRGGGGRREMLSLSFLFLILIVIGALFLSRIHSTCFLLILFSVIFSFTIMTPFSDSHSRASPAHLAILPNHSLCPLLHICSVSFSPTCCSEEERSLLSLSLSFSLGMWTCFCGAPAFSEFSL